MIALKEHLGRSTNANRQGFTLIEIVMAIVLLGILAVAAAVLVPSPTAANLVAAARQIQSDIEYAKQNAMMTGVTSGAYFKKNQDYTVYQSTTSTPLSSPLTRQDMANILSTYYPNINIT